jgi:hypothetical protein
MRRLSRRSVLAAAACLLPSPGWAERPIKAERVRVLKSRRVLQLLGADRVLKSYPIALGRHPVGPKERLGDGRTPEGSISSIAEPLARPITVRSTSLIPM